MTRWGVTRWRITILLMLLIAAWGAGYVFDETLRQDEFWRTIGTLLIGTGFVNMVMASLFTQTHSDGPTPVTVENGPNDPANVKETE